MFFCATRLDGLEERINYAAIEIIECQGQPMKALFIRNDPNPLEKGRNGLEPESVSGPFVLWRVIGGV